MNKIILTVFTPAYNRAYSLPRTYDSLLKQTCKEFIWLIVDDGSTDNTKDLVQEWQKADNGFEIRYVYKENGGMHTAHNTAYENIDTELNVCIDSDDAMPERAVELILNKWKEVSGKGYAGIIALDSDMNTGNIIGKGFPEGLTETTVSGYYAAGGAGDKKMIYRTDIINEYPPYPVFEGEKYVSLAYKYRLIDQKYKMAVLDEIVCLVEYQQDGSSNNMIKQYYRNPKGFAFWRKVRMQYPDSKKRVFIDCIHYVAESRLAGNKHYIKESPEKLLTTVAVPLGIVLEKYIRKKNDA
ncbi:MAG: glycosyltransferase family 2 protein [Lachnospiraceae bacterium]|nr:glycosyltransferase family 2 protein [Lachnospiraceae bacterium]